MVGSAVLVGDSPCCSKSCDVSTPNSTPRAFLFGTKQETDIKKMRYDLVLLKPGATMLNPRATRTVYTRYRQISKQIKCKQN